MRRHMDGELIDLGTEEMLNETGEQAAAEVAREPERNSDVAAQADAAREVPEAMMAAEEMANAGGGQPLPEGLRHRLEGQFGGADFSAVRVFDGAEGERATRGVQAGAATLGSNIFFRNGRFDPASPDGLRLLAHELTHVRQVAGGEAPAGDVRVGATGSGAEHEAEAVADAVASGGRAPHVAGGHHPATVRRGEAGVHQGIEMQAAGLGNGPRLGHDTGAAAPEAGTAQNGALQIYSGNFMRDLSQLNVPLVVNALNDLPREPLNDPAGRAHGTIGAGGAMTITSAVVRALGVLELGEEVVNQTVTASTIGTYRPQEHMDNPMGNSVGRDGDLAILTMDTAAAPNPVTAAPGVVVPGAPAVTFGARSASAERGADGERTDRDLTYQAQGAAIAGTQVENPELYRVSPGGLGNHIYNSVEWAKTEWVMAAHFGATPTGRMHLGSGLHTVEDYFSHSNFIEVALNSYVDRALAARRAHPRAPAAGPQAHFVDEVQRGGRQQLRDDEGQAVQGRWVDTLYDATVPTGPQGRGPARQAVTTGSFGGTDTRVSLAHVMLPRLPQLQQAIETTIDRAFALVGQDNGPGSWAQLTAALGRDRPAAAVRILLEGFDGAGIQVECPTGIGLSYGQIQITPSWLPFVGARHISYPNGWHFTNSTLGLRDAVTFYAGLYRSAQSTINTVRGVVNSVGRFLIGPFAYILTALNAIISAIQRQLEEVRNRVRDEIKRRLTRALIAMLNSVSGENIPRAARENFGDALETAHHAVEGLTHASSLESRLGGRHDGVTAEGDLSPSAAPAGMTAEDWQRRVEARVGRVERVVGSDGRPYFRPIDEQGHRRYLPPSHSEISKDHPGHDAQLETSANPNSDAAPGQLGHAELPAGQHTEAGGARDSDGHAGESAHTPGNEHENGSVFFGLHRALAVEADKHVMEQMQVVWGEGSLLGDGRRYQMRNDQTDEHGDRSLAVDSAGMHDTVMAEARTRAAAEATAAGQEHRQHGQDVRDQLQALRQTPPVRDLLNLADYFISHPDDSTWWRTIMDGYVGAHEDEVLGAIRARNQTRGERTVPAAAPAPANRAS